MVISATRGDAEVAALQAVEVGLVADAVTCADSRAIGSASALSDRGAWLPWQARTARQKTGRRSSELRITHAPDGVG